MDPQWRWSEMQMQSLNPSLLPWLLKPTSPPLQPQRHKHLEIQLEGALVHLSLEVLKATTSSVSIFKHFHTSELPTYLVDYVVISNNHQVVVQHLWVCPTLKPDLFLFILPGSIILVFFPFFKGPQWLYLLSVTQLCFDRLLTRIRYNNAWLSAVLSVVYYWINRVQVIISGSLLSQHRQGE